MKKANAGLALLTCLVLFTHVIYQVVSYIMFFYNPVISKVLGFSVMGLFVCHAVISIIIVIHNHDAKDVKYMALNVRTLLQRIFAFVMCALLPTHIFAGKVLSKNAGTIFYNLEELAQVLFFWAMFSHIALSLTNAFVTFGWLTDIKKKKTMDVVFFIVCMLLFVATSFVVVLTQRKIYYG